MVSTGTNILVSGTGNNQTVIHTVYDVYKDSYHQCREIVQQLANLPTYDACNSIFWYVYENVKYLEDPGNNQLIKTPSRLLADGVGDCKSMAIMAASCLRCLGIPCVFRFVSFSNKPIYTHVYIVAYDEQDNEIIIDPVERINGQPKFNYAQAYALKKDIRC